MAPVEGHQIGRALVAEAGQVAQSRVELVPGGDAAGVERLQEAGLAPLQDALRTGVGEVGLEAGAQLLESLLLIAEEGEGRRVAVLVGIALVERGVFVARSEEHTSELQSLMRISYAVFCLKKNRQDHHT